MAYTTTEVTLYRAAMPPEAWKNGIEPRERRTRRTAVDDLIGGLDRYLGDVAHALELLDRDDDETVRGSRYLHAVRLRHWATWAARLSDPYVRHGFGPAPDGSEWRIDRRIEYR